MRPRAAAFGLHLALTTFLLLAPASVIASLTGDDGTVGSANQLDKLVHLVLFLLLGALAPAHRATLPLLAAYAAATEVVQAFVPGRSADWLDLAVDLLGLALGAWLVRGSARRGRGRKT